MATLGSILGDIGKDLATTQVCDALITCCKEICANPSATWLTTIAGLAGGPQLWICFLGGKSLLDWRSGKKNEAEVRARFNALMGELTELRAAAGRADLVNDRLTRILDREDFVLARLPGYEKANIAARVGEEVCAVLQELGIGGSAAAEHWAALSRIETAIGRVESTQAVHGDKLEELLREVREMRDAAINKAEQTAPVEDETKQALEDALDRLARDAAAGSFTAASIVERRNVSDVVDYLSARSARIEASRKQLNERVDEELITISRELASVALLTGRIADAEFALRRILALAPGDLDATNDLGHIARLRGDIPEAERLYSDALSRASDDAARARAAGNLGIIYAIRGDLDLAETMFTKALSINESLGRRDGMANQFGNLGLLSFTRGLLDRAEEYHTMALEIHGALGMIERVAGTYGNLGILYRTRGDLRRAEKMHTKAFAIHEEVGNKEGMADAFAALALVFQSKGELDRAEKMHVKGLEIEETLGRRAGIARQHGNLGIIYAARGELDRAEKSYLVALALEESLGRVEGMASHYGNLGILYKSRGNLNLAEEMYVKALAINETLGRKQGMANQYGNLGILYAARDEIDRARDAWIRALTLFEQVGAKPKIEQTKQNLDSLPPATA